MYIFLVLLVLLFMLIENYNDKYSKKPLLGEKFTLIICAFIIILAAFRSVYVGEDTLSYAYDYETMPLISFKDIFKEFNGYEGYYVLSKIFSMLSCPRWLWFGFVELVYVSSIYSLIRKYSLNPLFSILIFITSGLFTFSLAGMKQVLGMGFMMFSFICFVDKKYFLSIILGFIAFTCHASVLIMCGAYILYLFRNYKYCNTVVLIAVGLLIYEGETILARMILILGNEHYEAYLNFRSSYSATPLIYYLVILALSLFGYKYLLKNNRGFAKFLLGCTLLTCSIQTFSLFSPSTFRLAYLYLPFFTLFIPNSISLIPQKNNKSALFIILIICMVFYFLYVNRNSTYSFT